MSEVWVAAVGAAATVYSADAQGDAAETSAAGSAASAAISQQQYQTSRADQTPYMDAGTKALNQLEELNSGDYSSFTESPDYQYTLEQGIKSVDRSASASGTQYSGGQLAALADYSSGLASQNYSDYYNRIYDLASLGQNAAAGVGNSGTTAATESGEATENAAETQAEGEVAQASTYSDLANQLAEAFGDWLGDDDDDDDDDDTVYEV